jgi:hypothetical protein
MAEEVKAEDILNNLKVKIDRTIKSLEDKKNSAEEDAKGYAVRLAEFFKDTSADSKGHRERAYLNYKIAKAAAESYGIAVTQLKWIV